MPDLPNLRLERGVIWLTIFVSAASLGAFAFVATGAYNVAANDRHYNITEYVLSFALARSVTARTAGRSAPERDEPGFVRLGALHFETGCAACHGKPGEAASPIVAGMYPAPPPLDRAAEEWTRPELAWIVHNGFKMTGMPAWAGKGREDEVWPMVTFIEALPGMDAASYAAMVGSAGSPQEPLAALGEAPASAAFCESCHGGRGVPPVSALVPPLAIQSPEYLLRALEDYSRDIRQSGMMEPIAAGLSDQQMRELAEFFGEAHSAEPRSAPVAETVDTIGAALAWRGDPEHDIPACFGCHGAAAKPDFPRLTGLSELYIANQLELFRSGVRARSPQALVMAKIARRLADTDVEAVAAYVGSLDGNPEMAIGSRASAP